MEYAAAAWERAMQLQELMLKAIGGELHWFRAAEILGIAKQLGLRHVQLQGSEGPEVIAALEGLTVVKAIRGAVGVLGTAREVDLSDLEGALVQALRQVGTQCLEVLVGGPDDGIGNEVREMAGDTEHQVVVLGRHAFHVGPQGPPEQDAHQRAVGRSRVRRNVFHLRSCHR